MAENEAFNLAIKGGQYYLMGVYKDPIFGMDINWQCALFGHQIDRAEGDIYYEKGNGERLYFDGVLYTCKRNGCTWEKFDGDKRPYKKTVIIEGKEQDVNERDSGIPVSDKR